MKPGPVVSDSSPLIALGQIGQLDLLGRLFSAVLVPPAVVRETASGSALPDWITERAPIQPIGSRILAVSLGPGESEAIALSLEVGARWLILDDRPARRLAQALGLPVIGTLGVLLAAKRRGFLSTVRAPVDALAWVGFRMSPHLRDRVLRDASE